MPAEIAWLPDSGVVPKKSTEVFYLLGSKYFERFSTLEKWLDEKGDRHLILLDTAIENYVALQEEKCLEHPRFHLYFAQEGEVWEDLARRVATEFPTPHIEMEGDEELSLVVKKEAFLAHTFAAEEVYAPVLFRNLKANFTRWEDSLLASSFTGAFCDTPAFICGAGPSLAQVTPSLQKMGESGLIFGCGSAVPALSFAGVSAHFGIAFDPNEEEVHRFKQNGDFTLPLLYANRLHPRVFDYACYTPIYIRSGTGGAVERWVEEETELPPAFPLEELGREALSVTTSAIALAIDFGCNPIILCGVDLAFASGKRYAPGIEADTGGDRSLLFALERKAIADFAAKHPNVTFLRGTVGGAPIEGIDQRPLKTIELPRGDDLRGKLHRLMMKAKKLPSPMPTLNKLYSSRDRTIDLLRKLQATTSPGMQALIENDLKKEEAYLLFIALSEPWVTKQICNEKSKRKNGTFSSER